MVEKVSHLGVDLNTGTLTGLVTLKSATGGVLHSYSYDYSNVRTTGLSENFQLFSGTQWFPRDYDISEGGYNDAGPIIEDKEFALDFHKEWYYGDHEIADYPGVEEGNYTIVKGIIL